MSGVAPSSRFSISAAAIALFISAAAMTITAETVAARPRSDAQATAKAQDTPDPLVILVSLRKQRLSVFDKTGKITESPISSGNSENPTLTGVFSVIEKNKDHESNLFDGAPMPFMQRLTWTGTAMHAGNLPGYPASHGCIRLPYNVAERLFGMTVMNTRIIVSGDDLALQTIDHDKLFVPFRDPVPAPAPADPLVSALPSKVASLALVAPAIAAPQPVTASNEPQLSSKAKARFAETARLFDAIKTAEDNRSTVWEKVKAGNREIEANKEKLVTQQGLIQSASRDAEKAKSAKVAAESQLVSVMRKAMLPQSAASLEALAMAEEAAELRLIELTDKHDAAILNLAAQKAALDPIKAQLETAIAARRAMDDDLKTANLNLKNAQNAHAVAKRADARYMKPISVFVSRKTQRLYVRQGFEPVIEVPVTIDNPDQPLGTHVFTAMGANTAGTSLQWQVVSIAPLGSSAAKADSKSEKKRKGQAESEPSWRSLTARSALDRVQFSPEALDVITERVKLGSSLIISDESTSQYFGTGTDFAVATR